MAKASTRVRNDKEPRKRGRPLKKKFQPPSRTQVEVQVPPTQEAVSKTKPRPWPIPQKSSALRSRQRPQCQVDPAPHQMLEQQVHYSSSTTTPAFLVWLPSQLIASRNLFYC
ncbi:hypothetical protein P692DRAFT_20840905 [Suillus brevipes Sb2]|nr:hypothetical protein P692DRAFT_20840905 [Suillus brevipes Sb2]